MASTFLGKTEKRTFKSSGNSWGKGDLLETQLKKGKSDLMSKKLDFLEEKMKDFQEGLTQKYKGLGEGLAKLQKQLDVHARESEGVI